MDDLTEIRQSVHERNVTIDDIKTCFNCRDADIDEKTGEIWISIPQIGHWLHIEEYETLTKYLEAAKNNRPRATSTERRFLKVVAENGYYDLWTETTDKIRAVAEKMTALLVKRGLLRELPDSEGVFELTDDGRKAIEK